MGKQKIGQIKQRILVQGDVNQLLQNEILVTESEGYTILRERRKDSSIKTSVIIPLEEFINLKNKTYGKEESKKTKTYES